MRHYAIGDIHGHLDQLVQVHAWIEADKIAHGDPTDPVVHIGDYADRGPDVRGTIEYLIDGTARDRSWICLLGNHDRLMLKFLQDPMELDPAREDLHWLQPNLGGLVTLKSYGVDATEDGSLDAILAEGRLKVPSQHLDFIDNLKVSHAAPGLFFCHAGVRPGIPLNAQTENDLVWIRHEFLTSLEDHGALVVHGHTPSKEIMYCGNRLGIDTAAAYGGPLSAVVIENGNIFQLTEAGRVPIHKPFPETASP